VKWQSVISVALTVMATSTAACSAGPLNLGQGPDILWWTDHETGDVSDWEQDGGSIWTAAGGQLDVVTGVARSGRYALRASATSSDMLSEAVVQRAGVMPVDAYYSAWYFVPVAETPIHYWVFFKLRSRCVASDPSAGAAEVWDLDFLADGAGGMRFGLFGHAKNANEPPVAMPSVPIGRWFQIEAFLRATDDDTGQLTVWMDDVNIFDVQARPTWPTQVMPCVEWSVGGITDMITPPSATFYVDDAAISKKRLGPSYPVFWHGN
jgi:hypothetical protein